MKVSGLELGGSHGSQGLGWAWKEQRMLQISGLTPALTLSCLEIVLSKTSFWPLEESNARWHGQDIRPNVDHRLMFLNSAS